MVKTIKTRKSTQSLPHVIIDAGPGCGKTTTAVAALNLICSKKKPSWYETATQEQKDIIDMMGGVYHSIGFQAFNKSIATELQEKVPSQVQAKTFHSFGYKALASAGYKFKMSGDNVKYQIKDMMGYDKRDRMSKEDFAESVVIAKVVSLLKNNLLKPTEKNVLQIVKHNNIEVNGNLKKIVKICKQVIDKALAIKKGVQQWIDFDDMIWLPVALDLDFSDAGFDLLVCDESQDLNPVQHELVLRSGKRLICVGDPRQAIYGFRGADAESMTTLENILADTSRGVKVLPLQTSFRLPKSGVANVNDFAPELKALPDAIEGEVLNQFMDEIKPVKGDLIVSRINANIFGLAFRLLKEGTPVQIQGRDFGRQLLKVINDRCQMDEDIEMAHRAIQAFDEEERDRLSKKTFSDKLIDVHAEKISCLFALTQGCKTVQDMINVVETLFNEDLRREDVVLLSTVHKAKGLEANTVYFLEPSLVPHPMAKLEHEIKQEYNLKFVAETRHMEKLIYVHARKQEDTRDEDEGRLAE